MRLELGPTAATPTMRIPVGMHSLPSTCRLEITLLSAVSVQWVVL